MSDRLFLPISTTQSPRERELTDVVIMFDHLCGLLGCVRPADLIVSVQDIQDGYTPKDHADELLARLTDLKTSSWDRFRKLVGNARDPICVKMMEWYLKRSKQRTALRRQADNRRQAAADGRFVSKATK